MSREDLMMWSLLLGIANFVMTWGVALYMYLSNKNKATNAKIDALAEELNKSIIDHGNRLTKVESGPTHQDLAKLHEKSNDVRADLSKLTGLVTGMNRLLSSIDDHLRSKVA